MTTPSKRALFESGEVKTGRVLGAVGSVLIFLLLSMSALLLIYLHETPQAVPLIAAPPAPHVDADEGAQRRALEQRQRAELSSYRWANKDHTLVTIPIERARQIIASRGVEGYGPIQPSGGAR